VGGSGAVMHADKPKRQADDRAGKRHAALARTIWGECSLPGGTIVEDYLRSRGLELPDEPVLRSHPRCPRGDERLPAMVALMSDPATGEPRGIHRTFLRRDGSGHVGKMMLGHAGIIRLCEPMTNGLGITEGIETALAVAQRVGWGPVWATGSAGGIRNFPPLVMRTLNIFCDHDSAGLEAAQRCAERWADVGLETLIHMPPDGEDWADAAARISP
jgi:putative DNA primase/helicase